MRHLVKKNQKHVGIVDLLKTKYIFDVQFPIFGISNNYRNLWTEDNILKIETDSGVYTLDNKNIQGTTLGQRRLRINNSKLYMPRVVLHNIAQLLHSKYKVFIDNIGILFEYKKITRVPLEYYKVREVIQKDDGCVLHFNGIVNPIQVSSKIAYGINYVGFLITKIGYITYEYSEEFKKNTWRKI